ncbi:calcium-binding protein [Primorskyibacter sp. S87]|uniref:calcium-binding protein n=1 Tax=Primorskyibacter sp. S87 TaxID=3415126 RepID=UPI003C7BCC22
MFFLAGILGLMAVGGVAMMDLASGITTNEDEDDLALDGNSDSMAGSDLADSADQLDVAGMTGHALSVPDVSDKDPGPGLILPGGAEDDLFIGGNGQDQLNGYAGHDMVLGGAGADDLHGADGHDTLDGGFGADTLQGWNGDDQLLGRKGDDVLWGHGGSDRMSGGQGYDSLHGGEGDDLMSGGHQDDVVHGGLGNDLLYGGHGQDTLFGGWGNDTLVGQDDAVGRLSPDELGHNIRDYLNGGGGDDLILAGTDDVVTPGEGEDHIVLEEQTNSGSPVQVLDYDVTEDQLLIAWDIQNNPDPDIEVSQDPQNSDLSRVSVNGIVIAHVQSTDVIRPNDIIVVDRTGWPTLDANRSGS